MNKILKIKKPKLNFDCFLPEEVEKAYTEGVYSDSPANRKLGRVGMSYKDYAEKSHKTEENDTKEKEDKLIYFKDGKINVLESTLLKYPLLNKIKGNIDNFTKENVKKLGVNYDEVHDFINTLYDKNLELSKKINIPKFLYHKSPPSIRKEIENEGLKPKIGDSYKAHWEGEKKENELEPVIFAYDKNKKEYDTTWDDDIWEIDTNKLDNKNWKKDPDEYMTNKYGSIVYNKVIPKEAIKLIHKGSGKNNF